MAVGAGDLQSEVEALLIRLSEIERERDEGLCAARGGSISAIMGHLQKSRNGA